MAFERNEGQTDAQVEFLARGAGYSLFLTGTEAVLSLRPRPQVETGDTMSSRPGDPTVVRMALVGANSAAEIEGLGIQAGKSHYLQGNDPAKWNGGVTRYEKVRYRGVYPGIDLVYYGNQQQLEYDFIVAPQQNPDRISLDFTGVQGIHLDDAGNLVLRTAHGDITQHRPVVYQEISGRRSSIEARYRLLAGNRVGFDVGRYDHGRPLVIDPVLAYSTYLGGSGDDNVAAMEIDESGNLYAVGTTASINFPVKGALQANNGAGNDVFVTKFNPDGNGLVYSTYLGGSGEDFGLGVAINAGGEAYVVGHTTSTNFPVKAAVQAGHATDGGLQDAFVVKLNGAGNSLVFGTYLGGAGSDYGLAIDLDRSGNIYLAGSTGSADYPRVGALDDTLGGNQDAFVTKLNASAASILYSTFLGGSGSEQISGMVVDTIPTRPDVAYLTGYTTSVDFPINPADTLQSTFGGGMDAFVTMLGPLVNDQPNTVVLGFSSYLGGSSGDSGADIAVDANGYAVVVGRTNTPAITPFPTLNATQPNPAGGTDGFVAGFNLLNAGNLLYSTYVGGSGDDQVKEVELDERGYAYVAGFTNSTDLAGPAPEFGMQHTNGGGYDAFASRYHSLGHLLWSTYLGGAGDDYGYAVALYGTGSIFVGGSSASANLPTRGPYQASNGGAIDAFVARLGVRSFRTNPQDFDGDLVGDVLWRNSSNGTSAIWRSADSGSPQAVATAALAWNIVGVGDFNGDAKSDILWRNSANGSNAIWRSGNSATLQPITAVTSSAWQIVGVGQFNADAEADVLWRSSSTGANAIWLSGNYATQQAVTGVTNQAWKVAGVGDFNGDFYADILWRNASTGSNGIWLSGDSTKQQTVMGVTNASWTIAGVGDFLGDGKSDILWRNVSTGANVIWRGAMYAEQQSLPSVNIDWSVAAIGDYNGDGRSDILWRNGRSGTNAIWRSGSPTNTQPVSGVISLAWKVVP